MARSRQRDFNLYCMVVCFAAALCAAPSFAARSLDYGKKYNECIDKADGSMPDLSQCAIDENARRDKTLNTDYKKLMSKLPKERQMKLKAAQAQWIKYRDANCEYYWDPDGGQAARLNSDECVLRMTVERSVELESFIDAL